MGLQVNRRNTHNDNYVITQHHTNQILAEAKRLLQRNEEQFTTLRKLISNSHNLCHPRRAGFELTGGPGHQIVQAMNELRDAKEAMNVAQARIAMAKSRVQCAVSTLDTREQTKGDK